MGTYTPDTYSLLRDRADKSLSSKLSRDPSFPKGPAGRSIVLTHMACAGYSESHVEQAGTILSAAGIQ